MILAVSSYKLSGKTRPWIANPGHSELFDLWRQLSVLSATPHDWDSYGAEPPNRLSLMVGEQILNESLKRGVVPSQIVPSAEGGVAICFYDSGRYADVEALNSGDILAVQRGRAGSPVVWSVEDGKLGQTIERIRTFFQE